MTTPNDMDIAIAKLAFAEWQKDRPSIDHQADCIQVAALAVARQREALIKVIEPLANGAKQSATETEDHESGAFALGESSAAEEILKLLRA